MTTVTLEPSSSLMPFAMFAVVKIPLPPSHWNPLQHLPLALNFVEIPVPLSVFVYSAAFTVSRRSWRLMAFKFPKPLSATEVLLPVSRDDFASSLSTLTFSTSVVSCCLLRILASRLPQPLSVAEVLCPVT